MKRYFQAGDVVFREGEISLTAYVVLSGSVELRKMGPRKMVVLSTLGKGEPFGEMGVLDKSPRNATAVAASDLTVEVIPRSEFLHDLETKPGMSLKIIRKLIERLRAADTMLAQRGGLGERDDSGNISATQLGFTEQNKPRVGLLRRLFGVGNRPPPRLPLLAVKEKNSPLVVLITNIAGDYEGNLTSKRILAALDAIPACIVRPVSVYIPAAGTLDDDNQNPNERLAVSITQGRLLLSKNNADLVIWGDADPDGRLVELRFLAHGNEDRAGTFSPELPLDMPLEFDDAWINLLRASVLAALEPRTDSHVLALRPALAMEVTQAASVLESSRSFMSLGEQTTVYIAFANAAAAAGNMDQNAEFYFSAIESYRQAINLLSEQVSRPLGLVHRQLGLTLQAAGERLADPDLLERATDAYRSACQTITREEAPHEWAVLQNRLGVALYRLDLKTGRNAPLRESLAAFQCALQVITRAEEPFRWAEIMNNLAQTLQIYGEQVKSTEALERAVEACRTSCEVRNQETVPLLWAATQNNMGSALFLLARHTKNLDFARQAADAFRGALGVYEVHGAAKLATVAEKNLAHASQLFETQSRRIVAQPTWAGSSTTNDTI